MERNASAYVAEFIGTFFLVLFICMAVSIQVGGFRAPDFVLIGLVHAFTLAMLIYALGSASGAHFNPAVTISLLGLRKIKAGDAGVYLIMQLAGAVAAALVTKAMLQDEGALANYGTPSVSAFLSGRALAGLVGEALGAFVLMFAIMALAVNPRGERSWAGWIIGATLGVAVLVMAPLTGASFNPARWFGPAIVSGDWTDGWIYVIGPIVGAALATVVYKLVVLDPEHKRSEAPIEKYQ
jgi:MIP family channel proteins